MRKPPLLTVALADLKHDLTMNEADTNISGDCGQAQDLTGVKFGRWTALGRVGDAVSKKGRKERRWLCRCECGTEKIVRSVNLQSGTSTSCGCYQREHMGDVKRKHGMGTSSEYSIWGMIKQRCHNPKAHNYSDYGGRGIKVDDRWRNSFDAFFSDMGRRLRAQKLHLGYREDAMSK